MQRPELGVSNLLRGSTLMDSEIEASIMSAHSEMIECLRPLVGARIRRAQLLIWPSPDGRSHTDVRLNLDLALKSRGFQSLTFSTAPDGQTPSVFPETCQPQYTWREINERQAVWKSREYFKNVNTLEYESFDMNDAEEFRGVVDSTIEKIEVICNQVDDSSVGIKLETSTGKCIFSVAGPAGNCVLRRLNRDWFGFAVKSVPIGELR